MLGLGWVSSCLAPLVLPSHATRRFPQTADEVAAAQRSIPVDHFKHASLMTTHASERRRHSARVFGIDSASSAGQASPLRPRPPARRKPGTASARESKAVDGHTSSPSVFAGLSEAEQRARAFRPDALVFQSPFTERSATATVKQAKVEAQAAAQAASDGRPHPLLQPRQPGRPSTGASGRGRAKPSVAPHEAAGGLVNSRPTSAAQAVRAASYFTRDVLEGATATSSLTPGGEKDRAYLSRMGADSSILARRRAAQDEADDDAHAAAASRSRSSLAQTESKWSLSRPGSRSVPGPSEVRVGGSLAATMPAANESSDAASNASGHGAAQYGAHVRGLSEGTTNPFLRCPALFEDVVSSSTAEFSVRPGTGRGETPAHPPLGEYIRSPPGSSRQLKQSSSVTHPAGRHSGRLGGDRTWSRGPQDDQAAPAEHTLRQDEGEGLDDGGGGETAWWVRNKTPSVAALLRAKVAGGAAGGAVGPDGRPLTQNKADLLFRRRLHESVAQLSAAVHSSGKGIIQLLSSYLDANWRPEELGGGGTFMTGGGSTDKVRSRKRYLPYAVYAQATDMRARVAASRERNRDTARSLASPLRATWGVGGTSPAGQTTPEEAAQRRLRSQQAATSARIASLLGASDGGAAAAEDLASWSSLAPVSVDVGQAGKLQLNTALPSEEPSSHIAQATSGSVALDEPVHTSSIFNPYHSPVFTCDIPPSVRLRIADARRAAEAGRALPAAKQQCSDMGMTLADAMGLGAVDDAQVVPPAVSTAAAGAAPSRAHAPLARAKSDVTGASSRVAVELPERSTTRPGSRRGVLVRSPSHGARPSSSTGRRTPSANRRLTFDLPPDTAADAQ